MNKRTWLLFLAFALLFAAGIYFGRREARESHRTVAAPEPPSHRTPSREQNTAAPVEPNSAPSTPARKLTAPAAAILQTLAALRAGGTDSSALLDALRRQLLGADVLQAIAAIEEFLASGENVLTGAEFAIGPGGSQLASSPTLRVMLLDVLGELSRTARSDAGAKVARVILEQKTSADEWAVAMRNVAWHDRQSAPFLAAKMREMLAWQPWREQPSAGMLESFDVIVFTKDASFFPTLTELQRDGSRELQQAATVALDRLAEATPLDVITYLNTHPATLAEVPLVRADYYAKADLAQPAQREALELHLSRPEISLAEKTKIIKALATPASFVSDNLLTASAPANDDTARQAALGKTVDTWLTANRFPELGTELRQLQQRLGSP